MDITEAENILIRNNIDNGADSICQIAMLFCQKLYFQQMTLDEATDALITASQNVLIQN